MKTKDKKIYYTYLQLRDFSPTFRQIIQSSCWLKKEKKTGATFFFSFFQLQHKKAKRFFDPASSKDKIKKLTSRMCL